VSRERRNTIWAAAAGVLVLIAVGLRIQNALHMEIGLDYDAWGHWAYISHLLQSWKLPAPHDGWSMAHPPLYYYLAGLVGRGPAGGDRETVFVMMRFVSTFAGLAIVGLAVVLTHRVDPGNIKRAVLTACVLLFLPVHIYISAMLHEEMLCALFTSLAVSILAFEGLSQPRAPARHDLALGVLCGLALMTKLTGALTLAVVLATLALRELSGGQPGRGLARIARVLAVALPLGGWFYARNLIEFGYLYPHGLPVHEVMFSMPPGTRDVLDYLRIPLATFTDPRLLVPSLLHSVWGSTYVTLWFDGQGCFLPVRAPHLLELGRVLMILGLVPCIAFVWGTTRGVRRAWSTRGSGPDLPLLLIVAATVAGYVLFTWRNPWFAVLKASYLLGISVPFAFYAGGVLDRWTDSARSRARAVIVTGTLLALIAASTATFTYGLMFERRGLPGIPWEELRVEGR